MKKKDIKTIFTILVIIVYIFINVIDSTLSSRIEETIDEFISENKTIEAMKPTIVSTELTIQYINVGQADSILISNNNRHMLIDAGNNEDGSKLVNYLKSQGIETLDYVIGTHPHEDHIGGLDDIINNFNINNIYLPEAYITTKTFEDVLIAIENKSLNITIPQINEEISLGEAMLRVIYTGDDTEELNNSSIVLKMMFGTTSYLFTGDATSELEYKILNSDIDVDVLKVAHHGSEYSTTNEFLSKVTPSYTIISVGSNNDYNHPSSNVISRIKMYTENIYRTDELGTIILTSDGNDIYITNIFTDTNG